jgi:serine/threonine protein kinase
MAPEILSENPSYNVKVDIWALGCIFHQMLFGSFPFHAPNMISLKSKFDRMKKYVPPKKIKISEECKNILEKMLTKDVK